MKNLYEDVLVKQSIDADQLSADTNGVAVDTMGYHNAMLVIPVGDVDGTTGDETYAVNVEESANGSTGWAAVSGATVSIARDGDDNVYTIQLLGLGVDRERYLRAVLDVGGTTPIIDMAAVFLLGQADHAPVTQDN